MRNFTEVDTKNDFEKFKQGWIHYYEIRGFNDEHKWWILKNRQDCPFLRLEKEMTDDMLRWCLANGLCDFYNPRKQGKAEQKRLIKRILSLNLSEEEWFEGIEKRKVCCTDTVSLRESVPMFDEFFILIMECAKAKKEEVPITLARAIIKKSPKFISDRGLRKTITADPDINKELTECVVQYIVNTGKSICLFPELIIEEQLWDYIDKNFEKFDKKHIFHRPDVPRKLKLREIRTDVYCSSIKDNMTAYDVLAWYNYYTDRIPKGMFPIIINTFRCNDWKDVVKKAPGIFGFLHNPSAEICELAASLGVEQNSQKISQEDSQKTSPKEEAAPLNPYHAKYYLVKFRENLCDEDDLHCIRIVEGKDMKEFMDGTFSISFGNLDDDEKRYVKNCARVFEITEEEKRVIEKFGLSNIESGYFRFSTDRMF